MKTKLLFTAALMAATVGTQAVPSTGSSMLVQLLESQRLENNVEVLAEGEETTVNVPTPIASYDFEEKSADVTFKHLGSSTAPYSMPLSETEKGLQFTEGGGVNDLGYVQMANPFKDNAGIETAGATISLWVYRDNTKAKALFGFGMGLDQYEDFNNSGSFGLQTDGYMPYNMYAVANADEWIDFNRLNNSVPIPEKTMSMVTMTFAPTEVVLYVDGVKANWGPGNHGGGELTDLYPKMLSRLKDHFTHFYVGKGGFQGTFAGKADKLGFYDKALTADEVKALYDSQKDAYANPVDLNAKEDVTAQYIVNADFSDAEDMYKGWTNEGMPCDAERSATLGMPFMSENPGTANFDFYQVLEVPNGIYTVSVQCLSHVDTRDNYDAIRLYANDVRSIIPQNGTYGDNAVANVATTWTDNKELNRVTVANVMVDDGTLRIGISKSARKGSVCFDNFRLEKASLSDMMSAYNSMKADAENLGEANLQSDLKARLDAALVEPTEFTVDAYAEAYFSLQAAYDVCNYYLANYQNLTDYVSTCKADVAGSTGDAAALNSAISAVEGIDWTSVTAEGLQQAYDQLIEAHHAYQSAANPTGNYKFDMTWLLTNPNPATNNATGWYSDILGDVDEFDEHGNKIADRNNIGVANNGVYQGETQGTWFVEKWANVAWEQLDGNGWTIYQRAIVPAGAYQMTAATFTDLPWNAKETVSGVADASLTVGFGSGTLVDGAPIEWVEHERFTSDKEQNENSNNLNPLKYKEVSFNLTEAATAENPLKLGIYIGAENDADWFGINDMKLYKVATQTINLVESSTSYEVEANAFANVTLTRNLKADAWNTFCVPFDMTAEQLEANGITDVRALESANVEGESVTLNFSEDNVNAVEAGVPYLVKVDASYDGTINVENVLVSAAEPTTVSVEGGVSMTGNYAAGFVPQYAYFISNNAFYYADEANYVSLKGFRAYIQLNNGVQNANRLMINLDGEVTGIEDVLGEEAAEADKLVNVVSLDGMTVKAGVKKAEALDGLQKGIYIVDGKKYVVK